MILWATCASFDKFRCVSSRSIFVLTEVTGDESQYFLGFNRTWEPCFDNIRFHGRDLRILSVRLLESRPLRAHPPTMSASSTAEISSPLSNSLIAAARMADAETIAGTRPASAAVPLTTRTASSGPPAGSTKEDRHPAAAASFPRWLFHTPGQTSTAVFFASLDATVRHKDLTYLFRLLKPQTRLCASISLGKLTWVDVPREFTRGVAMNASALPSYLNSASNKLFPVFDPNIFEHELHDLVHLCLSRGYEMLESEEPSSLLPPGLPSPIRPSTTTDKSGYGDFQRGYHKPFSVRFRIMDRLLGHCWFIDARRIGEFALFEVTAPSDHEWDCTFISSGRVADRRLMLRSLPESICSGRCFVGNGDAGAEGNDRGDGATAAGQRLDYICSGDEELASFTIALLNCNRRIFSLNRPAAESGGLFSALRASKTSDVPRAFGLTVSPPHDRFIVMSTRVQFCRTFVLRSDVLPLKLSVSEFMEEVGSYRDRGFSATLLPQALPAPADSWRLEELEHLLSQLEEASRHLLWFRGS